MHEQLLKLVKNLYRAQFMAIDAYTELSKDPDLTEENQSDVRAMLADHETHRDRLRKVLEDAGEKLPDTSAKIVAWGADVMEFFQDKGQKYMKMQGNLNVERVLIDLYDIAAVFAQDNEEVLNVIDANADEDVEHAEWFKDATLGFAEEAYEGEGTEI